MINVPIPVVETPVTFTVGASVYPTPVFIILKPVTVPEETTASALAPVPPPPVIVTLLTSTFLDDVIDFRVLAS